ncbi:CD109 antigen-like [Dreissena polymorpha]|uniref:CD109 antigen-like n=1 Tax=Dreissena polymorpha TaxID=45954 RepID=UPI0022646AF2|nr:CD109 antigen-like [Dreissena polymorpha]
MGLPYFRYTFGKPVVGNVKLQVKQRYGGGFYDPAAAQTEFPIYGKAPFKIPMTLIGRLVRFLDSNTVQVVANVTETATGVTQQGSAYITFYKSPFVIEFFPNMPDNFKPGFGPYPVTIRVKERDERPPVSPMQKVKVTTNFFTDKPIQGPMQKSALTFPNVDVISPFILGDTIMIEEKSYDLNEKGIVEFDLPIPANTATFTIKAEFQDEVVYKEVSRFRSPNDVFLKIEMTNATGLQIGDKATVKFSSKTNPSKLNYLVLSRGSIVVFGTVPFSGGSFKFNITKEMAPSSRLVAYFINTDGEIVADGLNFVVEDMFENKVSVEYDKTQVVPKAPVNLKVTADSGSLVNVLAVDKSVILFRQGNDITPQRVW